MFFNKKSPDTSDSPEALKGRLEIIEELERIMRDASRSILVLLKAFALDLKELETAAFRQRIDQLGESIGSAEKPKTLKRTIQKELPHLEKFASKQHSVLNERESELRDSIRLLSNAMALLNRENDAYHHKILTQGENLQRLVDLDDLRKIKTCLANEVRTLEQMVHAKRKAEEQQLSVLSTRVQSLQKELDKTRNESRRDALTGVFNRRAMDERLQSLIDDNQLKRNAFALIIIDIDDFKMINDRYGHLVGDGVIKAVAGVCAAIFRNEDFIARFGGEEFVILMPGASLRVARKRAEKLCHSIERSRFSVDEESGEMIIQFTISLGVTEYMQHDTPKTIMDRADQALLEAKTQGKNRVVTS